MEKYLGEIQISNHDRAYRKQKEALDKLRNPCNGRRILEVAQICGCGVAHGGREGTYIVAPWGQRQPVSVHPKDTSPGMRNAARKFLEKVLEYRISNSPSTVIRA